MKNYKFGLDGVEYSVDIEDLDGTFFEVTVNGTVHNVELKQEKKEESFVAKPIARPQGSGSASSAAKPAAPSAGGNAVKAPLPGVITGVKVNVGDKINIGDTLILFEAMKMQNSILAEQAGTVKEIKVAVGDAVLQDADVLILE